MSREILGAGSSDSDSEEVEYIAMNSASETSLLVQSQEKYEVTTPYTVTDPDSMSIEGAVGGYEQRRRCQGTTDGMAKVEIAKTKTPCFVYTLTFFSAIGGFLFGYDTGVVSGAMLLIRDYFHLSSVMQEVVVSVTIGAAAVFALLGGLSNDYLGRKLTTIIASFIFTVGAICLGLAQNTAMLIAGRIIVGAGIGIASMTVPVYIAESAPVGLRGRLVTLNNLFITGGQFIASILDGAFSYDKTQGWRYMLGLAAVPSIIQFVGFMFMPESPRWLVRKGLDDKAREVLMAIRGTSDIQREYDAIKQNCEEDRQLEEKQGREWTWVKILKTPPVRRALFVGCGLQMFQQLAGINTVMYYSATIIKMAGVKSESMAIWLSALTASFNFIFTFVGIWLVERIGRRHLVLGSLVGVTLSLGILAIGFQLAAVHSPSITLQEPISFTEPAYAAACMSKSYCEGCVEDTRCGFCYNDYGQGAENASCLATSTEDPTKSLGGRCNRSGLEGELVWAYEYCPTAYSWIAILGLVLYLMFFAPGMGPMPWTINSEIYPTWARSTGNSIATAVNWSCNLLVSMTFLTLTESITKYGTYWLYSGIVVLAIVFIVVFLPETKGKTLEQVEELFDKPWCECGKSKYSNLHRTHSET